MFPALPSREVFKCVIRQCGEDLALECAAQMKQGQVISLDNSLAIAAASYGIDFKLPLADSIIYATARKYNALIWTQDCDFESLEGVKYLAKK